MVLLELNKQVLSDRKNWDYKPWIFAAGLGYFLFCCLLLSILIWQAFYYSESLMGLVLTNAGTQMFITFYVVFNPIIVCSLAWQTTIYSLQLGSWGPTTFKSFCAIADQEWSNPFLAMQMFMSKKSTTPAWFVLLMCIFLQGAISSFLTNQFFRWNTCVDLSNVMQDIPVFGNNVTSFSTLENADALMFAESGSIITTPKSILSSYLYKYSDGTDFWGPKLDIAAVATVFGLSHKVKCTVSTTPVSVLKTAVYYSGIWSNLNLNVTLSTNDLDEVEVRKTSVYFKSESISSTIHLHVKEKLEATSTVNQYFYVCETTSKLGYVMANRSDMTALYFTPTSIPQSKPDRMIHPSKAYFNHLRNLLSIPTANITSDSQLKHMKLFRTLGYFEKPISDKTVKFQPIDPNEQIKIIEDELVASGARPWASIHLI
ncbi:hypothetical protein BC833DRAFT_583656 [Globomyces pollinis-pini]|nr:hypothetical protein BC833DRAFT_583656 [Globomyces pollinis-pini]